MSDTVGRDVDLVLAFLNTRDVENGIDVLDGFRAWREWVEDRGLGRPGSESTVQQARDALRAAVTDGSSELPAVVGARLGVRLDDGTPTLVADDALGHVLSAAVRLAIAGEWGRVKICPADDCRWAFYDRSRNRSRSWCSMEACGNREKARQFRRRLRAGTAGTSGT